MALRRGILFPPILMLLAASASAGVIRGTLWLGALPRAGEVAAPRVQKGVADAVVYLERIPDNVEARLAHPMTGVWIFRKSVSLPAPSIVQKGLKFSPRVAVVAAGSRVEFSNTDRVYHNAFSVSAARRFDLGKYAPGHRDTLLFKRPGVINLHDDIFPDMLGYLVVTPNHAFARPDSTGRFELPRLPAGSYTLRVWHPHRGEIRRNILVPKRGDVDVELKL